MDYDNSYNYQGGSMSYGTGVAGGYDNGGNYGMNNGGYDNNGYSQNGTPSTPTKTFSSKQVVPIVSSMLGKIITHNTDSFTYFNSPIMNVSICGLVSSHRLNPAGSIDYIINDCTGTINGRFYSNANLPEVTEGYVKVIGVLKEFQGKISINIHNIEPVVDVNFVTEHNLSCIASYLYYKKKNNGIPNQSAVDYNNDQNSMGSMEQTIYEYVKSAMTSPQNEYGVPLQSIVSYCTSKGFSESDVRYTIEEMVSSIQLFESGPEMYKCQWSVCYKQVQ